MEVTIGVQSIPREIVVETSESTEQIEAALRKAIDDGGLFVLTDEKGGRVMIPADKIGYIELGGNGQRRIGFGSL